MTYDIVRHFARCHPAVLNDPGPQPKAWAYSLSFSNSALFFLA